MQVSAIRPGLAARNQWKAIASLPGRMASASLIAPTDPRTTPRWPCRDTGISSNPDREDGASILCVDQQRGSLAAATLSQTRSHIIATRLANAAVAHRLALSAPLLCA